MQVCKFVHVITSIEGTPMLICQTVILYINFVFFIVCSTGGLILDYAVAKYRGIAVFSPVMNGTFPFCISKLYSWSSVTVQ